MKCEKIKENRYLVVTLLTIAVVIAYFMIDGMGMIANTYKYVEKYLFVNDSSLDSGSISDATGIVRSMVASHISRIAYLSIALFIVVFVTLKHHISFKSEKTQGIVVLIPYLRVFIGLIAAYYVLTIGTVFPHEIFTGYYSFGSWRYFFRIVAAFVVFGGIIVDWRSLIFSVRGFPFSHPKLSKMIYVLSIAVVSCMLVEFQIGSKMEMNTYMLIFNIMYWIIIQALVDVITRNVKIGAFVSLGFAYIIGLVNDVVYQFRGNYVMYGDLTVVRTALEVAGNYTYRFHSWFWISLVLLIAAVTMTILIKFPKHCNPEGKEIAVRAGIAVGIIIGVIISFNTGLLYNNIFGVSWDYNQNVRYNGYIPYFLSNMNSIKRVTLEGYSADKAEVELLSYTDTETQNHTYPNIIIIQNEAFADLSVAYDIETNQDYMPFIRGLTENTRKGYLNMSVTGGPTANTEFEILMRSTLGFLPFGSVPYTQYVNADLPSVADVLRNQSVPYYTVAYHPYYAAGYRRTAVYDHFGFDEVIFEDNFREDFPKEDIIRDYLSDSADYRRVEEFYEDFRSRSDAPWFCFNVTIQNHGGYTQTFDPAPEDQVYVTNFEAPESFNDYLSLIKISDDAFRELIEYFEQCDEPTIIAMYGDHQPKFDDEAVEVLSAHTVDGYSRLNDYYVPYIIWANFDIDESDTLGDAGHSGELNTLSTNYFASTVFETAGIRLTDYDRYLLDLHERVPAITAIGVWDSEGNYYASAQETPHAGELSSYQMVQYNLLFDDDNRLTDRFG